MNQTKLHIAFRAFAEAQQEHPIQQTQTAAVPARGCRKSKIFSWRFYAASMFALLATSICVATPGTNYVVQGATNFQATIDLSAPGDYLVVQGAPYFENLTFSKPITVLRSGTNLI